MYQRSSIETIMILTFSCSDCTTLPIYAYLKLPCLGLESGTADRPIVVSSGTYHRGHLYDEWPNRSLHTSESSWPLCTTLGSGCAGRGSQWLLNSIGRKRGTHIIWSNAGRKGQRLRNWRQSFCSIDRFGWVMEVALQNLLVMAPSFRFFP